jgi:hypothetical protein
LLTEGPDMGKTGYIIHIRENERDCVVKLDKDPQREYQEVKVVEMKSVAKQLLDRGDDLNKTAKRSLSRPESG